MDIQSSLWDPALHPSGLIPRSELAGSHGHSIFNIFQELPYHSTAAVAFYLPTSRAQVFQFSPPPLQHCSFLFSFVFVVVMLMDMRWHLIVVQLDISLRMRDIEHLFICERSFVYLLWRNFHLSPLPMFWIRLCGFLLLSFRSFRYVFWIVVPYQIYDWQLFSLILLVAFSLCEYIVILDAQNLSIFLKSILSVFLRFLCFWCHSWETFAKSSAVKLLPYAFSYEVYRNTGFLNGDSPGACQTRKLVVMLWVGFWGSSRPFCPFYQAACFHSRCSWDDAVELYLRWLVGTWGDGYGSWVVKSSHTSLLSPRLSCFVVVWPRQFPHLQKSWLWLFLPVLPLLLWRRGLL
jgi:hypothetical protein